MSLTAFHRLAATTITVLLLGCPGPDNTPPTVTIVSPADSDTVRGWIDVQARASDNDRVSRVFLLVDGQYQATDSLGEAGIFRFRLNTAALTSDTTHVLACVAFDPAGNSDTSSQVNVFVWPGTRHTGTITSNEIWEPGGNPHIIEGELILQAILLIKPGVEVQMTEGAGIRVGAGGQGLAGLKAAGTQDSVVVFTSNEPTPQPGDWQAISFLPNARADSNILRHCVIEYGGRGSGLGMVLSEQAEVVVASCTLRQSSTNGAVGQEHGFSAFSNNHVSMCAGFPVLVHPGNAGTVGPVNTYLENGYNGIGVNGGQLEVDALWDCLGVPYYIVATIDIGGPANPVLTIASGCSLLFSDSAALRVGVGQPGILTAQGLAGPITFSSFSSAPGPQTWPGIEFWEHADPARTVLYNCVVDRAGGNGIAAIVTYKEVTIARTTVRNSAADGVRCLTSGFLYFAANTITGCGGCPLSLEASYVGTLGSDNKLTGNARDSIEVIGGRIINSSQWRNHGVPYLVKGTLLVGSVDMPVLIIDQGTVVVFEQDGALEVGRDDRGGVSASGVPDSILFCGREARAGAWQGIRLYSLTMTSTVFDHCRLLHAGARGRGGIYVDRCVPEITNNEIGFSSSYCIFLMETPLDPDLLREENWLHDWHPDYEDIGEGGF